MLEEKLAELKKTLASMESVVVAYSGGVDSTFLAKVASDVLGDKAVAVTLKSEVHPQWEFDEAVEIARELGLNHVTMEIKALEIPHFADNPPERCYYCKKEILKNLMEFAEKRGIQYVIEGTNFDDVSDFRPGMRALAETGAKSPLKEVGLAKADIRKLSKELGLPTWNKPSYACLASRFPYGVRIDKEKLTAVDKAEVFLRSLGLGQLRVRHHNQIARIEITEDSMDAILKHRKDIVKKLKQLGYAYVTLDLQGYRSGSLNEVLKSQ